MLLRTAALWALLVCLLASCTSGSPEPKRPWMQVLDAEARIFMFHNFLTDAECDHIVSLARPHLERSGVVDSTTGGSQISDIRTSQGTFLDRGQDETISTIEERIARWTLLPAGNGEGLQVLHYEPGEKYDAHWDYFFDKVNGESNGGNRYATVLMYLNTVEEGGETVFPNIPAPGGDNGPGFSECARRHLAAKPVKGSAVLFHSIKPSGELERRSLHTACPVIRGEKFAAPKWLHVGHYAMGGEAPVPVQQHPQKVGGPLGCRDVDENCEQWAANGECENNKLFMIGSKAQPGTCVKACDACLEIFSAAEQTHSQA
ncbi:putative prolyl 4-hydroxylase 4 [Chlorella vulgaris]